MSNTATPQSNLEDFLAALAKIGFQPGRRDQQGSPDRDLALKTPQGNNLLRVCIDYEGEQQPHRIHLIKLDGLPSQIIKWECLNLSANMPSAGLLALINASV